ncbi:unnamed protein product [Polarella glacialis]|uniref:Uncharacterized protein n=1 Tax=Polarella glacialis TaxID=89957 RepID=A0A813ILJ2_POLGL|nr:unnamed protein product [Polarella glacialis]
MAAAKQARDGPRAPCPRGASESTCAAWCSAVAPEGTTVSSRLDGPCSVARAASSCICKERNVIFASCLSRCPSRDNSPKQQQAEAAAATAAATAAAAIKAQTATSTTTAASASKSTSAAPAPTHSSSSTEAESLSSSSTKVADTGSQRYLLYDTRVHVSFAAQVEVLFLAMAIVLDLNRRLDASCGNDGSALCHRWTLVLPPWCSVPHWYSEFPAAGIRWKDLFDVKQLRKEVPVVEFEDFSRQSGGASADLGVVMTPSSASSRLKGGKGDFLGFAEQVQACEANGQQLPQPGRKSKSVVYSGYCDSDIALAGYRCGVLRSGSSHEALVDLVVASAGERSSGRRTARSVLLKHLDGAGLHAPHGSYSKKFHPALRPAGALRKAAAAFAEDALGRAPYLGVHLRRNEFVVMHPETTPDAVAAAARINWLLKELGLEQVFVATDALPGFREELRSRVKAALYFFAPDDGAILPDVKGQEELIVLQVAAKARHFIGSAGSAFSAAVRRERQHLGLPKASSEEAMPALMSKMRGAPENLSKHRSSENRSGKRALPASLPVASLAAGACLLGSMPSFLQPSQAPAGQSAAKDQMLRGGQGQNVHGAVEQQSASSHYSSANAGLLGAAAGALCLLGHASNSRALRSPAVVLLASAGAEAPKAAFQPAKQMGATAPLGFFDPVGFAKEGDESGFRNLRAAEIKHGSYGFAALFILSGVAELAIWKQDDKKEPGNFGDPLGLGQYSEDMRGKELNNGRMAMIAALGIVAADIFTGKDGMQQLGLGATRERTSRVALRATADQVEVFQPAKQMGATAPLGFFDPVGFTKEGDESGFRNLRAAEIKHGRVAMMAAVGAVAQHYIQFPGFEGVPADLAAVTTAPGSYGFAALFILSGVAELAIWKQDDKKEPGNFGDPLGLGQYTEDMRGKELNNGRMAMIAALGIVAADIFTGKDGMQQLGLGAIRERTSRVALRATAANGEVFQPAKQMGATAPLGFFDPVGFTKEGDESGFRNLRAAEIKHGRVAMMAAVGAVAQHYIQFPGFEGVPADLAAVTTAPGSYGFAALFVLSGVAELAIWKQDDKKEPGNFGDPLGLGQYNEDMRGKELNNGRMAMIAALGIVAADIFTGKDGMQQLGLGAIRERISRVALRATAANGDVFQPAKQMGATAPLGFFDPVVFTKGGPNFGDPLGLGQYNGDMRGKELNNGHMAMIAALGIVAADIFTGKDGMQQLGLGASGNSHCASCNFGRRRDQASATFGGVPADLAAVTTAPGSYGFAALFILSGVAELAIWKQDDKKEPGNFGDPLGLGQYNEDMRGKELNNGRMAMIAALGIVAADIFTGKDGMQQLGLGAIRERTSRVALRATAANGDVFQPAKQMGATAPLGFFDPAGFTKEGDESGFRNLRAAEIKHGRVAMMAAVGAVAQHYIHFPGFEGVPADLAAVTTAPGSYGFAALFILSGVAELAIWKQDDQKEPGNFGDPLGLGQYNEDMRGKELNNGRMAMIAALGIVAADIFTGKDGMQQLGLGAIRERTSRVALRATAAKGEVFQPAKQMGATAPLGFFDPVGFTKEGDESGFRNLRAAEIKHGRVAMMAAVGAVAQHYIQLPGFEGVPADLAAVTTAPGSYGFAALFILSGVAELAIWKQDDKKEPGNFGDPLGLGQYNEDMRGKELNNGRMAMVAALGIVAADIFTGKDGMQQLGL